MEGLRIGRTIGQLFKKSLRNKKEEEGGEASLNSLKQALTLDFLSPFIPSGCQFTNSA